MTLQSTSPRSRGERRYPQTRFTPALPKPWLILLAGATWSGVGVILIHYAYVWLVPLAAHQIWPLALAGGILGAAIYRFGFSHMARKNLARIDLLHARPCVFAFQRWQSYPLVALMIGLGVALRSSPLPKAYLSVLYLGIGIGLLASGLLYLAPLRSRSSI